jgi:hypothetical protein
MGIEKAAPRMAAPRKLSARRKRYTSLAVQEAFAGARKRLAIALARTDFSV